MGIIPTPANYFSMYHLNIDGAVQITGSHNPKEYNGFKMIMSNQSFLTTIDESKNICKLSATSVEIFFSCPIASPPLPATKSLYAFSAPSVTAPICVS